MLNKIKQFNSFDEIEPGMVIDARDNYNKWYIAIVTARILEDKVFKLRIHYYKFNERWDEECGV